MLKSELYYYYCCCFYGNWPTFLESPFLHFNSLFFLHFMSLVFLNHFQHQPRNTNVAAAAAAKSLQSCLTLCDPIDGSPSEAPVPGILQTRTLEWSAISFSNAWKWKVKVKLLSYVWLSATPWTAAYKAPPSMGCSRREYWSGLPFRWVCNNFGV